MTKGDLIALIAFAIFGITALKEKQKQGEPMNNKYKKLRLYGAAVTYNLSMIMALLPASLSAPALIALFKNQFVSQIPISMPIGTFELLIFGSVINSFMFTCIGFYFYSIMKKEMSK